MRKNNENDKDITYVTRSPNDKTKLNIVYIKEDSIDTIYKNNLDLIGRNSRPTLPPKFKLSAKEKLAAQRE
jgi:hypothetical protein